jgi:hypothetical protein
VFWVPFGRDDVVMETELTAPAAENVATSALQVVLELKVKVPV